MKPTASKPASDVIERYFDSSRVDVNDMEDPNQVCRQKPSSLPEGLPWAAAAASPGII